MVKKGQIRPFRSKYPSIFYFYLSIIFTFVGMIPACS